MIVGHAALAFAVAAWVAFRAGVDRDRALLVGLAAGGFAVAPDVDMGYALVGLASADALGVWALVDAFWEAGHVVHRGATHSLLVGAVAAAGFGLVAARGTIRSLGVAVLVVLVAAAAAFDGALVASVIGSFVLAGCVVAVLARRAGLSTRVVAATALFGVLVHPFGDLFTGTPPPFFYPLDVATLSEPVPLSTDPTLHLLGAFGLELATVWLAAAVYLRIHGRSIVPRIDPRAALGAGYAGAALVLPPPTLEASYHFVFSVLAVGTVGAVTDPPLPDLRAEPSRWTVAMTGLAAVTAAWLAYGVAYALL